MLIIAKTIPKYNKCNFGDVSVVMIKKNIENSTQYKI
jgi:hypothetical protein